MRRIRVLLVDANDDFLDGLVAWMEKSPRLEVIGRAHSGHEAIERNSLLHPDLLLMDAALPDLSGFEVTRHLKSGSGAPLIVLMTFHGSRVARDRARSAGADECLSKMETTEQLLPVLERLLRSSNADESANEVGLIDGVGMRAPKPAEKPEERREAHGRRRKNQ